MQCIAFYKKILGLFILIIFHLHAIAQVEKGYSSSRKVHLTPPGRKIEATIDIKLNPAADPDKVYYWFDNISIKRTQGGFAGYLLDGIFTEFTYPENVLLTKGNFKNGLKTGIWCEWSDAGFLKSREKWRKGLKNGKSEIFSQEGILVRIEKFRRGSLVYSRVVNDSTASPGSRILKAPKYLWNKTRNLFSSKK